MKYQAGGGRVSRVVHAGYVILGALAVLGCGDAGDAGEDLGAEASALQGNHRAFCAHARNLNRTIDRLLDRAETLTTRGKLCEAHGLLMEGMQRLQELRGKHHADVSAIDLGYAELSGVARDVAKRAAERGLACGSAAGEGQPPTTNLRISDNQTLKGTVGFGRPLFSATLEGQIAYTSVVIEGVPNEESGAIGAPALPIYRRLFAIPEGATPVLVSARFVSDGRPVHTLLRPNQEEPVDADEPDDFLFESSAFTIDKTAYASTAALPPDTCRVDPAGSVGGVRLAQLTCSAARYVPATQLLTLARSVEFEIRFDSKAVDPAFISARFLSPFEGRLSSLRRAILNGDVLNQHVRPSGPVALTCFGEELLILTHSSLKSAANNLAAWKRTKGISTAVKTIDDLTTDQIRDLVKNEYDNCRVRPSYLLLLGDVDTIDQFVIDGIPTDLPYSLADGGTTGPFGLPVLANGRIPVVTLDQANVVVNKIIAYEQNPPALASFYNRLSLASFFQAKDGAKFKPADRDKRRFVRGSEEVRDVMLSNGYEVQRIYNRKTGAGYLTPALFDDGTPLPADLDAASGFAWDGDKDDIIDAFNDGRFLVMHRDHGWKGGWANPRFSTVDIPSLTNGNLTPIVYSINCQSGRFDDPGADNFAERLLRLDGGGAVAVVGDTRNSPTNPNSELARGLFDATWPNTLAGYGDGTSVRRMGDILHYALSYVASVYGVTSKNAQKELKLFHLFGDPTLDMWTQAPRLRLSQILHPIDLFERPALSQLDPAAVLRVSYPVEGATLTALGPDPVAGFRPIARGTVTDGEAILNGFSDDLNGAPIDYFSLRYSASIENGVSVRVRSDVEEPK